MKLTACDRCFISNIKMVDTFVNKPSFVFILLFLFSVEYFMLRIYHYNFLFTAFYIFCCDIVFT